MALKFEEIQAINGLSDILYDFLPGTPHPFADQRISFPGCANKVGLGDFWKGGSKKTAITLLLTETLSNARDRFCPLIEDIVQTALIYRNGKRKPLRRKEIEDLNKKIEIIGFKIPELWKKVFLNSLEGEETEPKSSEKKERNETALKSIKELKQEILELSKFEAHKRGFGFEKFLNKLFSAYGLEPRKSFRITGEQIDGSFQLKGNTYLVEAKWQNEKVGENDLLTFKGKIDGKSAWSRGLFISFNGFSEKGLEAFVKGKPTNMIGMDGQDIYFILEGKLNLGEAIELKARRAAETNDFFVSVYELHNLYKLQ